MKVVLGWLFSVPLSLLALWWAVVCIGRAQLLTAIVSFGFAVCFFCMAVPAAMLSLGRISPRASFDAEGTTFRPDRVVDAAVFGMVAGGVVAGGLAAILAPLGLLAIPIPHTFRYSLPFVAAALALLGIPVLWRMARRGGSKYLRLTQRGYEIAEVGMSSAGWDEIVAVTDHVPDQSRQMPNSVVVVNSDGSTAALAAGPITPGGRDLRELMRFYWQHPSLREELVDGRAIERLTKRRFQSTD